MTQNIGIYKWTNTINGKIYIGQSVNLEDRKNRFNDFSCKKYSGDLINKARQKYNSKVYWDYEVLEYCTPDELNDKEKYFIALYNSTDRKIGYNLTEGGKGRLGYKMSEEMKKKLSEAQKGEKSPRFGYHLTDEEKKNLSEKNKGEKNPMWGKHLSEEHRAKISKAISGEKNGFYGKRHTEETKQLISDFMSKAIYQIDKTTNEIIREWKSACEASRVLGIERKGINRCCLKKPYYKTAGGFKWCYKADCLTE